MLNNLLLLFYCRDILLAVFLPNLLHLPEIGVAKPGDQDDDYDDNEEDPPNTNT